MVAISKPEVGDSLNLLLGAGLLFRVRDVFRAADALISLGRWLHRLPA